MKKILFLADINSTHTLKWIKSIAESEFHVGVFTLSIPPENNFDIKNKIEIFSEISFPNELMNSQGMLLKWKYISSLPYFKKVISQFNPDIIHAHYATSYGLLGALSGFHPFVLSVWGSDVFDFPKRSFFHKKLLQFNLSKADKILSTSHVMAEETAKYTSKSIDVTPFGVDTEIFKPIETKSLFDKNDIVVGTVKTLEKIYGIEYLIRAFKIVKDRHASLSLKLLIVGGGSLKNKLKDIVKELDLSSHTVFTGSVDHNQVPKYDNMLDIAVFVSIPDNESFGVAVIEASACKKPVVVSNVGGLPEVVENNVTGFVVPPKDIQATANAIEKLILDENLRTELGNNGRKRVQKLYNWKDNVILMTNIYKKILAK